jgi:hypothetical protein
MLNSRMFDLIMARLGGRRDAGLRALCVEEMNEKIKQLEDGAVKPWFMEDLLTDTMTIDQNYIVLPENFKQEVEEGRFRIQVDGKWKRCSRKVDYDTLRDHTENCASAMPEGYALFGNRIYVGPAPNLAYPWRLEAYVSSTPVVDDAQEITNPWAKHYFNLITLATIEVIAQFHIQSAAIMAKTEGPLKAAYDTFWRSVEARQHVNLDYEQE